MLDFSASVSLGGDGGAAGAGGPVTVKNGNGKAPAGILTFGQNAVGIMVQSVGGGGGNGAVGNSSGSLSSDSESSGVATAEEAPTRKITVTISAGGKGGAAGSGGEVEVANAARSGVRTLGSGSSGILAQSIGGGGGNAGGGSSSADGADYAPSVAIGGSGGAAGNGGAVTVQNDGTVVTGQTLSRQGSQTTTGGYRRQDGLAAPDDPEVVGFHDRAELRQPQLLDRADALDAGIVDQHVDRADLAVDPRHPVAHRGIAVHVHRDHGDGKTLPRGGLRQGRGAGRVAHSGGHPVAGAPARERGGQADAGAGPGDQDGRHVVGSQGLSRMARLSARASAAAVQSAFDGRVVTAEGTARL